MAGLRGRLAGMAGLTLAFRVGGGLYWLLPAAVTSLLGGVSNGGCSWSG